MTEPLVLVPPMLCDARVYWHQIVTLSSEIPVTFFPLTGGERIEEMASELLTASPGKFALAGCGLGGMVAMEVVRRAPERVTRLALMDTNSQADTPEIASGREPFIIAARSGRMDDVIRHEMNPAYLAPGPERMKIIQTVSEMARGLGAEAYVRQSRAMQRRKDQQATFRKIKQPALVICGEHDGLNPVRRHEFMAELIPYAKLEIIEGAGQLPSLEQPEILSDVLRTWMRQPLVLR